MYVCGFDASSFQIKQISLFENEFYDQSKAIILSKSKAVIYTQDTKNERPYYFKLKRLEKNIP